MTTDEWIREKERKLAELQKSNKPLEIAVRSVMAVQAKRIFIDGKNADGEEIGQYSDKEIYVSPDKNKGLKKFPLKGKGGETKFKNGNAHKTGYFENYLSFKEAVGRNKNLKSVDLFLTGELLRNWANAETLGKANAVKVDTNQYVVGLRAENSVKVERYGNVFGLSKTERDTFYKVAGAELAKVMK